MSSMALQGYQYKRWKNVSENVLMGNKHISMQFLITAAKKLPLKNIFE